MIYDCLELVIVRPAIALPGAYVVIIITLFFNSHKRTMSFKREYPNINKMKLECETICRIRFLLINVSSMSPTDTYTYTYKYMSPSAIHCPLPLPIAVASTELDLSTIVISEDQCSKIVRISD